MRYRKITVYLFTALFLAVAVFWGIKGAQWDGTVSLSVVLSRGGETEEIRCWKNDEGEYYLFLPGYAELSQAQFRIGTGNEIWIDGQPVENGMSCQGFQLNEPYALTCLAGGMVRHVSLVFLQSANVSTMYLDVASGTMAYIHREKGNKESGSLRLYTAEGQLDYTGKVEALEGHGNSSWYTEKKPYNLKLSQRGDLLGMGAAQNWILLANAFDPSQLRNKLVYDFADRFGLAYTPECRWVDLYLNGEYAGLYLLCERNEIDPQRVALGGKDSFLVSKEWEWRMEAQGQPFITTQANAALRIRDAAMDSGSILRIWQSAENAILAEDGTDPVTGKHWRELIDLDSWARKYLIEEVFGNVDGGTLSQYFYYDGGAGDGKLYAGPVWDYDLAMGNTYAYSEPAANMFYANIPDMWGSPWYYTLYCTQEFYTRITELYETEFLPLLTALLDTGIDAYTAEIAQAAAMNRLRWGDQEAETEAEYIRSYLTERMEFLNSIWLWGETYLTVLVRNQEGIPARYAVRPGEALPRLPEAENGWYDTGTGEDFDPAHPIVQDTQIAMKQPEENEQDWQEPEADVELLLCFGSVLVFLGILAAVWFVDITRRKGQKNERTNSKIPS